MVAQLRAVAGAALDDELEAPKAPNPLWRAVRPAAMVLLGALFLLAAIVANGRPTVFSDTTDYYAQANSVVRVTAAALFEGKPIITRKMIQDHFWRDDHPEQDLYHNAQGARSVYYGLFLYAAHWLGTIWLLAGLQACAAAAGVYALWRLLAPQAPDWGYLATMAALAIATPLPYVAAFAMPDAWTGVSVLAVLIYLLFADRIGWPGRAATLGALAFAFNAHASHLLMGAALVLCAAPLLLAFKMRARDVGRRSVAIGCAGAAAMALSATYAFVVHLRTGDDLHAPPFLAIRVIADGPGRDYLRATCPHDPKWDLCRFHTLPLKDSNTLIWSTNRKVAVFNVSTYQQRLRMKREEMAFVAAVIAYDPAGMATAALKNWWGQFFSISLAEVMIDPQQFLRSRYWGATALTPLILGAGPCKGAECKARFTDSALLWVHWTGVALAGLFLAWRLSRPDIRHALARRDLADYRTGAVAVMALLILATIVNAGVCGMISGVFGRYQARIVWLIPLAAALVAAAWGWRSRPRPHLVPDL